MFDAERARALGLEAAEIDLLASHPTPESFQHFLLTLPYDKDAYFASFRQMLRRARADCFAGALAGAAWISLHSHGPPLLIHMEAADIDHNLALYEREGRYGTLGASRSRSLTGKLPVFPSLRELVLSYYQDYNDTDPDPTVLTLRGYSDPVDLRQFGNRWLTAEDNLTDIEDHLWSLRFHKLFPDRPGLYARFPQEDGFYLAPRHLVENP
ncbi:MAG: hypothetical protein HY520_04275 [Candidatus Aenigmarchaeota archaeon]|nr:hypothetical protein [Candidatus Aenigmarchaeota archaeon]